MKWLIEEISSGLRQLQRKETWLVIGLLSLFGLLAYILLGMMALKRGRTLAIRRGYFCLALLSYAYIVGVALSRNPTIFF